MQHVTTGEGRALSGPLMEGREGTESVGFSTQPLSSVLMGPGVRPFPIINFSCESSGNASRKSLQITGCALGSLTHEHETPHYLVCPT